MLAAVKQYGLAEYLGAGPLVVDKFESGEISEPVGHALVRPPWTGGVAGLPVPFPGGCWQLRLGIGLHPRSARCAAVRVSPERGIGVGYHASQRDGGASRTPLHRYETAMPSTTSAEIGSKPTGTRLSATASPASSHRHSTSRLSPMRLVRPPLGQRVLDDVGRRRPYRCRVQDRISTQFRR